VEEHAEGVKKSGVPVAELFGEGEPLVLGVELLDWLALPEEAAEEEDSSEAEGDPTVTEGESDAEREKEGESVGETLALVEVDCLGEGLRESVLEGQADCVAPALPLRRSESVAGALRDKLGLAEGD
jgi:hypothetical protein